MNNLFLDPKMGKIYIEQHVKSQPCIISGRIGVDPHHIEARGAGGKNKTSRKDYSCIPLSHEYHQELDVIGIKRFVEKYRHRLEPIEKYVLLGHAFISFRKFVLTD